MTAVSLAEISAPPDIVRRRRYPIDQIDETDAALQTALSLWEINGKDGMLPARKDIDVLDLRPLIGRIHLVDVSDPDPANYRFRLFGSAVRFPGDNNYANFAIGAHTSPSFRQALMEDYAAVTFTGTPSYQHVVAMVNFQHYSYSRLILPLADDGRRVDQLMVCIHKRKFTDLAA